MDFYNTFFTQFELLPRITIVYGFDKNIEVHTDDGHTEIIKNGIAFEWLWFGVFIHIGS